MTDAIISNRYKTKEFGDLLSAWVTFFKRDAIVLINYLREQGLSDNKIAKDILKTTRQNFNIKYPRKGETQ